MSKYYSIYRGKSGIPMIVRTWDECKEEVIGCKGAVYKSFKTEKEAIEFLALNSEGKPKTVKNENKEEVALDLDNAGLVIYVDGLIAIDNGEEVFEDCGVGEDKDSALLRNVAGEVLGSLKATEFAINKGYKKVTIVYDYKGVECWALGTWKRNKELTQAYHEKMQDNMKKIDIRFVKVKGHSGDKLAKKALGIIA